MGVLCDKINSGFFGCLHPEIRSSKPKSVQTLSKERPRLVQTLSQKCPDCPKDGFILNVHTLLRKSGQL